MIVFQIPLEKLFTPEGVQLNKIGHATTIDVSQLMTHERFRFVIADIGKPLLWISGNKGYDFWKNEGHSHFADEGEAVLDDYSGGYCYFGSKWCDEAGHNVVILLEKYH